MKRSQLYINLMTAIKIAILLSVVMTSLLAFASDCNHFNNSEQAEKKEIASTASQDKMPDNNSSASLQSETSVNNNDFACKLFRTINKQEKGSTIVSPISVSYLLGMLNEGAGGETRKQITGVLGLGDNVHEINKYFKKMMGDAQSVDPSVKLKIANCIEVVSDYRINPQYKADMQKYYNAQADAVSYNASNILAKINNWCKTQTDGMIPELLKKGELNPNRVMYLLNAVYFKATWTDKFDPRSTRDLDFITHDGKTVKHPMMHRNGKAVYGKNDLCKMLCLPYGNKQYSMVVLLPNEGKTTDDIIRNLSAQKLKEWQSQMRTQDVEILLPRFTAENETHLEDVLSAMGMPRAFGGNAEFPNMIKKKNLFVSMMKQKAKIEVNEEGTKASAVTVAEMAELSIPRYVYFYATRPFVYYIMEKSTGSIFFMGTYCFDETGEPVTLKDSLEERETEHEILVERKMPKRSEDEIFKSVEQMPLFLGGDAALMKYIESHLNYPPMAAQNKIQGKVVVQFVVDKTGKVGEVKVVRSVDKDLDEEAVRIVKSFPKFIPGRQNGRAVSVWYTLPVTFKLPLVQRK